MKLHAYKKSTSCTFMYIVQSSAKQNTINYFIAFSLNLLFSKYLIHRFW